MENGDKVDCMKQAASNSLDNSFRKVGPTLGCSFAALWHFGLHGKNNQVTLCRRAKKSAAISMDHNHYETPRQSPYL